MLRERGCRKLSVLFALVFLLNAVLMFAAAPEAFAGDTKEAKKEANIKHNDDLSLNTAKSLRFTKVRSLDETEPVERHVNFTWSDGDSEDYVWGETAFSTINDAVSAANPGDTIVVHPGTYEEQVNVNKENLTILASEDAEDRPIINTSSEGGNGFYVTAPGVTIQGFNIVYTGIGIDLDYDTVLEYGTTSANILNNVISGYGVGISVSLVTGELNIKDNDVTSDNGEGIYIDVISGGTVDISRNNIYNCYYDGLYIYCISDSEVVVSDNVVEDNGSYGAYIYLVGSGSGDPYNANTCDFIGNTILGNSYTGLYFSYIDFDAAVTIEDNNISDNGSDGLTVEYVGQEGSGFWDNPDYPNFKAPRVYVGNNSLCGNGESGFLHYDDWQYGTEVILENNDCSGNLEYGIDQYYSLQENSVLICRNNQINNNAWGGIRWDYPIETGSSYFLYNNRITGNGSEGGVYRWEGGVYLYDVYETAGAVEIGPNNVISDNAGPGIELYFVTGAEIKGNIIEGNVEGIVLNSSSNNLISGNRIIDNELLPTSGIHLGIDVQGNVANFNDLVGNGFGVYSEENSLTDATLNWWNNSGGPEAQGADEVSEYVDFSPWITRAYFQDERDSINLRRGRTAKVVLLADTMDSEGTPGKIIVPEKTVVFESSNPEIVSVDEDGKIRGLRQGTTTITALFANEPSIKVSVRSSGGDGSSRNRDDKKEAENEADPGEGSETENGDSESQDKLVIKLNIGQNVALVNDEPVQLDAPPYIQAGTGRTMIPIRFVSEILGAKVSWSSPTRQVIITDGEKNIVLTIGSGVVIVDGSAEDADSLPEIVSGRTFIGLRFVGETLGAQVDYDSATGQITITR